LFFDVTCHNVAVDLVGWWTIDGQPIPPGGPVPPPNGGAVPIPGFEVLDTPLQGPQKVTMHNDSHLFDGAPGGTSPGIEVEIVALSLVSVDPIQLEEHLGPLPEALRELRLGGLEETLPWVEVANQNGPISKQNPQHFPPDSFFDVFFEVDVPGAGLFPVEPVTVQPGGFVIVRERLQFINNAGEIDWRWAWEIHQAHEADLGDAPDSTNTHGVPMTAYPLTGVGANFPTVYRAGSPPHGPIHWAPHALAYLGPWVSLEFEADIWADQDGINNLDPPADVPDQDGFDDGVQVPLSLPHCQQTQFSYDVTITPMLINPPDLYVNVWFDWMRNGDWDDTPQCPDGTTAPEWAVQNQVISGYAPGMHTITTPLFTCWHPPGAVDPNPVWMRITISEQRWSSTGGTAGYGGAGPAPGYLYGETEDYYFEPIPEEPDEWDFGDAPERGLAYPPCPTNGVFPTCINPSPPGWIQHAISDPPSLFFGQNVDAENEGNAGLCPTCFPPYDKDECFADGDAGLIRPPSYTIQGPLAALAVVPCLASQTGSLGVVCTLAKWGPNVDIDVTNKTNEEAYVNVLMDWDKSGNWGGTSTCGPCSPTPGAVAPEHVLINFPVPPGYNGPLSGLMGAAPATFMIGPNPGYVWTRFTVTPNPVGMTHEWTGEGEFRDGETEDYLLHVKPAPVVSDCDWNEGDEHKMHWPQLPDLEPTGVDVDMFWVPLADDFKCTEDGKITDIHFWGSFADDCLPVGGPGSLTFRITLYSDIPAADSSTGYSMPGEPLRNWTFGPCDYVVRQVADDRIEDWYDPATEQYFPANHQKAFQYNICINEDEAFEQKAGTIYWLEIKDIIVDDPGVDPTYTFGWKTTQVQPNDLRWNDDAVWWNPDIAVGWTPLKYPHGHPYAELENPTLDLAFVITGEAAPPPPVDWGDANDPTYPTLAANFGASHVIVPRIYMGNTVDPDPDGQPSVAADGDDTDADGDDEDGVTFNTPLIPGLPAQITVNAFQAGPFISVWIDYDRDGGWGELQDYVVKSVLAVNAGDNVFGFQVPGSAKPGRTYVRVRFTTNPGIGFAGPATNGEVEDHVVDIKEPYVPKDPVKHVKWSQPPIEIDPVVGRVPTYCGWDEPSWSQIETMPPVTFCRPLAADDFRCLGRMPITSVHWWGSYYGWLERDLPPVLPREWRIGFWRNIRAGSVDDFSQPGELLWAVDVQADQVQIELAGIDTDLFPDVPPDTCFQYHVKLPESDWFWQDRYVDVAGAVSDTVFWISIQAVYDQDVEMVAYPWGWKTRPWGFEDDAVRKVPDYSGQFPECLWRPIEAAPACTELVSFDLAFELDTDPNYIKWEQAFTGFRRWPHYWDEESIGIEKEVTPTKWEQLPDPYWSGLHCHDGPAASQQITIADDWVCDGGDVTDLHWYGNYEVDSHGQEMRGSGIRMFHLSIHRIAPHACIPGDEVWSTGAPFAAVSETDTGLINSEGCKIYLYKYDLPDPYPQVMGNKYWLDISARAVQKANPPVWRWQEAGRSPKPIECGAAERNDPLPGKWRTIEWDRSHIMPPEPNWFSDMAFAITSGPGEKEVEIKHLVADDWPCTTRQPVTAVVWWGSYIGYRYRACDCLMAAPPVKPSYFLLSMWTDVRPNPADPVPYSHPGVKIWEYRAYEHDYDEVLVGFDKHPEDTEPGVPFAREPVFRYSVRLPRERWFHQKEEEAIYWFSVVAVYKEGTEIPYRWGWTNHKCSLWEPSGLIEAAHWKLDETSGTTASDSSGNGNHGTLVGDPTWQPGLGAVCGALDLDGNGDYVKTGDTTTGLDFAPGSFSASAWINAREVANGWRAILEYDRFSASGNRFGLWLSGAGKFHFRVGRDTKNSVQTLNANTWYLVSATYDAVKKEMNLYIDGQFDSSATYSTGFDSPVVSKATIGVCGSEDAEYFDGLIDDVRIYDYALSAVEIRALADMSKNDDAVTGQPDPTGATDEWIWEPLYDQAGASEDMSFILFTEPGCFPSWYSTYPDWLAYGKPNCWCGIYGNPQWPYQCDGDADGKDSGVPFRFRVFTGDLTMIVNNWRKKIDTADPCADVDHKDSGVPFRFRVFTGDLTMIVNNWRKKDGDLPGDCPRPE